MKMLKSGGWCPSNNIFQVMMAYLNPDELHPGAIKVAEQYRTNKQLFESTAVSYTREYAGGVQGVGEGKA